MNPYEQRQQQRAERLRARSTCMNNAPPAAVTMPIPKAVEATMKITGSPELKMWQRALADRSEIEHRMFDGRMVSWVGRVRLGLMSIRVARADLVLFTLEVRL